MWGRERERDKLKVNKLNKIYRWCLSTNAKDIGVLYIIYGIFAGIIATTLSLIIRMELSSPRNTIYNK